MAGLRQWQQGGHVVVAGVCEDMMFMRAGGVLVPDLGASSQGPSGSAGIAVDSVGSVPGACGVWGASCLMWGVLREGVWHLLSSFSLQYYW